MIEKEGSKNVAKKVRNVRSTTAVEQNSDQINETALFKHISSVIEKRKRRAERSVNREVTLMFWEVGRLINSDILGNERAEYGKKIVSALSKQLTAEYGDGFSKLNLYRMMLFAEQFADTKIVSTLSKQLSWSHFVELLHLKSDEARIYYAKDAAAKSYGVRELRRQISRKAFERGEIANAELCEGSIVPFNIFKDPCLLDVFGLKDNYLEADLEKAILNDIESFLLEFGDALSFVARQKRMIISDKKEVVLDLLLYSINHRRYVAIELKLGEFKAAYKGQMELYLKWLDRYARKPGDGPPIGMILCATADREEVSMLEMDKAGIAVAEYLTELPPKDMFERKIRDTLTEAKERLERRKLLPKSGERRINYYLEKKDDDDD